MNSSFILAPEGFDMRDVDPWGPLYEAKTYGTILAANIVRRREIANHGDTWEIEFPHHPGVFGLVPEAQTGLPEGTPMSNMVGAMINVKVMGIDRQEGLAACSRKEAVDQYLTKLIRKLAVGERIPGLVKFLGEGSVYTDIGGGVLVKLSAEQARISRGVPLDVQYQAEDRVELIVKRLDFGAKAIEVDLVNPWERWVFNRGEILLGKVVTIREKLAFIRVKPGVIGLVPNRKGVGFTLGEQIKFQVNAFDPQTRKLHLVEWNPDKAKQRRREITKSKSRKLNKGC